jgi:hypothetical protein
VSCHGTLKSVARARRPSDEQAIAALLAALESRPINEPSALPEDLVRNFNRAASRLAPEPTLLADYLVMLWLGALACAVLRMLLHWADLPFLGN